MIIPIEQTHTTNRVMIISLHEFPKSFMQISDNLLCYNRVLPIWRIKTENLAFFSCLSIFHHFRIDQAGNERWRRVACLVRLYEASLSSFPMWSTISVSSVQHESCSVFPSQASHFETRRHYTSHHMRHDSLPNLTPFPIHLPSSGPWKKTPLAGDRLE